MVPHFAKFQQSESQEKWIRISVFLETHLLDGIWLRRPENIMWYLVCNNPLHIAGLLTKLQVSLFVTARTTCLLFNERDLGHITVLVKALSELNLELCSYSDDSSSEEELLLKRAGSLKIGTDKANGWGKPIEREFKRLTSILTPLEQIRYRTLCRTCTVIVESVAELLVHRPELKEAHAYLRYLCKQEAIHAKAFVAKITDDGARLVSSNTHSRYVGHCVVIALAAIQGGLYGSVSRTVALDAPSLELQMRYTAVMLMGANFLHSVKPGYSRTEIAGKTLEHYKTQSYPAHWRPHIHARINGSPRSHSATSDLDYDSFEAHQGVAITTAVNGIFSSFTLAMNTDGYNLLTVTDGWPMVPVSVSNSTTYFPDILYV